jgi:chromosome segregation ATPase
VTAPAGTTSDRQSTPLDRRRDKAADAARAADQAQAGVTELEHRLQTNASMTSQQKQALRNAEAEASRLKRALKAGARERDRLAKAHEKAAARAAKARARSAAAESKYDKSVLADLVRREKAKDRADAAQPPAASTSKEIAPLPEVLPAKAANATLPPTRARTAVADPPPERRNAAAQSATRTAARKTAAAAGARTPRTRRTS